MQKESEKLFEWLYCQARTEVVESEEFENHYEFKFFRESHRPLYVIVPTMLLRSNYDDPLRTVRVAVTGGVNMEVIKSVYHPDAVYAGHTFGTFGRRDEARIFRLVTTSDEATHFYREIVWQRPTNADRRSPQMRQSYFADYLHLVEISQDGIFSGVDIAVSSIVQGVESLASDYFTRMQYLMSGIGQ